MHVSPDIINDPIVGILKPGHGSYWESEPLPVRCLDFRAPICAFTRYQPPEPPSEAQLTAMAKALDVTSAMKAEMTPRMVEVYREWRAEYLEAAGECELPELNDPDEIWGTFSELAVFISEDASTTTYSFRLAADPDHEMSLDYCGGVLDDVSIQG